MAENPRTNHSQKDRFHSGLTGMRLVRAGILTAEEVDLVLNFQKENKDVPFRQAVVRLGFASEEEVTRAIAKQSNIEYIADAEIAIDAYLPEVIPRELALRYNVAPYREEEGSITFLIANPTNIEVLDDLRTITGKNIVPLMATDSAIALAISEIYARSGGDLDLDFGDSEDAEEARTLELTEITDDSPVVKLVNFVIQKAVAEDASDIHIEPQEHDLRIRFRLDGVLQEIMRVPRSSQSAIISRIKVMADIDITETRKPQDGHCSLIINKKKIDFRVSSLPTAYGERVVLRILRTDSVLLELKDLGFSEKNLKLFERSFRKPYGAILVTGPTGSGKSTSLYAVVNVLNNPQKHILTAEDPVEYRLSGINQVQINNRAGLTFATALRSFLRCSPDIILVGEIRDAETAQIATEAALTGHLVLSTLHTNDAPSALTRLVEMGIEPFLVSSSIDCIVAQRLARKLCSDCAEEYTPEREALIRVGFSPDDLPSKMWRAKGCRKCNNTGYRGRTGVHELMVITEEIGKLTVAGATGDRIRDAAVAEGMTTLRQDGLEKARAGITSIEEILRVTV